MKPHFVVMPLTHAPLRLPVEQLVSAHLGRRWTVQEARDMGDFASHPAAILSDDAYAVFAKFSDAANGREQFEIELAGLQFLADHAAVLIPTPIGLLSVPGGSILVLEAVQQALERTPHHWREIGRALAHIHNVKGEQFGWKTHGYFGHLSQDNTPAGDWPTFYAERRLLPGLRLAHDSGNLPATFIKPLERLIARLPEFCGPEVRPSLLHGDAQQNNFISAEGDVVVIDPAVYFGHPEMDLAALDFFQPVPKDIFDGYREELPIDAGFEERRDLWHLWGLLATMTVEGAGHPDRLVAIIQRYMFETPRHKE